jgi:hypothetical protein
LKIYNRLRKRKEIEKVTEISEDKFPDILKKEIKKVDLTEVWFQINVDLDSFLYSIPKNRYDFLKVEQEQILGKEFKKWTPEEREDFFWNIRHEARLIDSRSPDPRQWDAFPEDVLTELEKSYAGKRRLKKSSLEDLEKMKRKNDQRK